MMLRYAHSGKLLLSGLAIALATVGFGGCSDDETTAPSKAATIIGEKKTVGNGEARSWLKLDDAGNPTSVGVTMTEGALTGLPDNPSGTPFELTLPTQASATAYNHVGLDWNPLGHPPVTIYTHPHFDLHFYHITAAERAAITLADSVSGYVDPGAEYVPAGYVIGPEIVPAMGFHAVDTGSHEFHHGAFDKTFIYGYYKGKMIFSEPMITVAYLQTQPNTTIDLKLPAKYPKTGLYYATKYSVKYDAATKEYTISLDGLTMR